MWSNVNWSRKLECNPNKKLKYMNDISDVSSQYTNP